MTNSITGRALDRGGLSFILAIVFTSVSFVVGFKKLGLLGVEDPYLEYALASDGPIYGLAKLTVYLRLVVDFHIELLKAAALTAIAMFVLDEIFSSWLPENFTLTLRCPIPLYIRQRRYKSWFGCDEDEGNGVDVPGLTERSWRIVQH